MTRKNRNLMDFIVVLRPKTKYAKIINMASIKSGKNIGIILAYNSASTLQDIYARIPKDVLDEIILADDGSTDNTLEVAEKLGVPSFTHPHRGYGGNIKFGLQKALERGGDYMVEIHGDGQYDPTAIPMALKKIHQGYDFLLGSRFTDLKQPLRDGMSFARYFPNIILSFFDRLILGVKIGEFHSGFRLYSRRLLDATDFNKGSDDHLYSFEIIVMAKYHNLKIGDVPIRCNYRKDHSSISIKKSFLYAFQTFYILLLYILAKVGIKTKLFRHSQKV